MGKLAFYIRLSEADADLGENGKDESNSIVNQRNLLYRFVQEQEEFAGCPVLEYFDDGISGTYFRKRDQFQVMVEDARDGVFDTLLVKDFSRLGRDYIEIGNYMDFIFPTLGIRFISVNDNYDSYKNFGKTGGMDVAFRNLLHQMYVRDLSVKVRTARRSRNEQGQYTAAFVPYGYRKDPKDRHRLLIYEPQAQVVRRIFRMAAEGKGLGKITRTLNSERVPAPIRGFYSKDGMEEWSEKCLWDKVSVLNILDNEEYTGKMIQNRYENSGFGDTKRVVKLPREKWTVIEDAIPVIITQEEFEYVRTHRTYKKGNQTRSGGVNLFCCPFCGRKLRLASNRKHYYCDVKLKVEGSRCGEIWADAEEIRGKVLESVRELRDLVMAERETQKNPSGKQKTDAGEHAEDALKRELEQCRKSVVSNYKTYVEGGMSKEDYLAARERSEKRKEEIELELERMRQESKDEGKRCEEIAAVVDYGCLDEYNGDMLSKVIERVLVYPDGDLEIVYRGERYL